jgi:hypothetical protein
VLFSQLGDDTTGQQFLDAIIGMISNPRQHSAGIGFRVEAVQLGRAGQTVNRRRALSKSFPNGNSMQQPNYFDKKNTAPG